ncbi:PR domain zinc finger protein 2 [Xiphophorus hellerii]|uniref:PR domain zinc finger protein 2 n=1 Tax=Xiphophorus hellerii TaxID=8084 RepID=UPI0013B3F685|nr:PR domain zinc finger protein 2-like [Xiphophorus hellerii]XP_032427580.1 PR domain zinc finger protein 2-like [Xiphophorus hellerii]XP_032427589.1 PR domain zinc finger protein 2-like [Xiphophorus hellerii]XP_032427597.1 PR domain zinc finger protein 2-like [Xiphophorus hellerii]
MEDSSHLYISERRDREDTQEQLDISWEHLYSHKLPIKATDKKAFVCQHCNRCFTCQQGLERHMHVHHPCKSPEKISTSMNRQHQEGRVPDNQLHPTVKENANLTEEEIPQALLSDSFQQQTQAIKTISTTVLENNGEQAEQYMLDVSSNISENLSFYIDGKILSTSTINNCEMEIRSGSSTLVGMDTLILGPAQISQVLHTDAEASGQQQSKRRTATPPLLPQIKTELQSEVVMSSSSSSLLSSLIENLFPQNTESEIVQEERTVFLSPKLKQLLEKQEGFKPTVALITDGQKSSSPVSLTVLPSGTGKFRRRTGSPTGSSQQILAANEETGEPDLLDLGDGSKRQIDAQCNSPVQQTGNETNDATQSVAVPEGSPVLSESWAPATGGNPCNQQPLDLSNTVKRNEDEASADAALDLSLQRKSPGELGSNSNVAEKVLISSEEQMISHVNPETPVVTDLTLVTGSDVVNPLEHVAEGLVYGLTLPPNSLTRSPASLTSLAMEPSPQCTIAFASPVTHTVLPAAPSLITVLAPPSSLSNPSNQPIQVLAPNISPEPLVICTENPLNSSQCDLTTAFASANSANIVTLSQPLDPTLNLPSHVFLTDQIALNPPMVESAPVSEVSFPPTVTLNDSLLKLASSTVLIECTIALEAPGSIVPATVTLQENTAEPLAPTQMVINQLEQQRITSLPDLQPVDPPVLVSAIPESVTLTSNTPVMSDSPPVADSKPGLGLVSTELPTKKVEEVSDGSVSMSETAPTTPPSPPPDKTEEEPLNETAVDAEEQTFTKNFICNVCERLFHSMKELGHHVADHADEWPYKCEFCVLLFGKPSALLDHRSSLHGVGKTYVCSACTKEFVYFCNLKQHQNELHPGQQCSYTEEEKGKLRPQNYNNTSKNNTDPSVTKSPEESKKSVKKEECEVDMTADELFTTIKIMTSDGCKIKGPDVRLGINQHYPSFKPPPFPYHNRSPAGSLASATNFTTHNIPQTFSTAIRCTKCGKSFDNMPELHKHILVCANASDKKRYTPRKNPVPLRHFAKTQNGVLSTTNSANGLNTSVRVSQGNRSKPNQEPPVKIKILNKRKKKFVQRIMPHRNKSISSANKLSPAQVEIFVCPHCNREFTMRRSRTKHMAVCPKKPKEMTKRKEGGISLTKENNEHSHRGVSHLKEKLQSPPRHNTRLQTSGSTKRPAILPVQTVFSSKRSKIIIKERIQPKEEAPMLAEVPIRTFNPSLRQYSRVQHSIKGIPIKITIVKPPQSVPLTDESAAAQTEEVASGAIKSCSEQKSSA